MSNFIQNLIVVAIIVAAVGYLAFQGYRLFAAKKKAGCGTCSSCPTSADEKKDVVQIKLH